MMQSLSEPASPASRRQLLQDKGLKTAVFEKSKVVGGRS
jgi:hypothetical protein